MADTRYYGTGRRKKSVARVYLMPGTGKITINKGTVFPKGMKKESKKKKEKGISCNDKMLSY